MHAIYKTEIAAKQQTLDDLRADLQSEEGQRQIAEGALATANADLQTANDNLTAAQTEIAAKQQTLDDLQADLQSRRRSTANCRRRSSSL